MICGLKEVIEEGRKRGIAIAAFNTPNSECAIAAIEAAEELNVPLIIAHAQLHEPIAPLDFIGPMMIAMAKASKTKVCVHLDHGEDFDYCRRAIEMGFTSVMIDCSTEQYEDNIKHTKRVVDYAHQHNVDVEAELGALPSREGGEGANDVKPEDLYTKVELVNDFISRTGVDALAIAFGTAHGIYKSKPVLNMDVISNVRKVTNIPLVMHGGSGISKEEYQEVIRRGIDKINYYTYMSYEGFAKAKEYANSKEADFYHNLAWAAKETMKEHLKRVLKIFSNIKE